MRCAVRSAVRRCAAVVGVVLAAPAAGQLAASTHLVTAGNRSCASFCDTTLAGSWSLDDSNSFNFVTSNWNPPGSAGVYYDSALLTSSMVSATAYQHFIEGLAGMPLGAAFNVLTVRYFERPCVFHHAAQPANSSGSRTFIDRPSLNGNPLAFVMVQPFSGPYNVGVTYDGAAGRWAIFHEDASVMGFEGFIVWDGTCDIGVQAGLLTCDSPVGSFCRLPGVADNDPDARILVTQLSTGVANPHTIGVFYDTLTGQWAVFNQDQAAIPVNAKFNYAKITVLLADSFEGNGLEGWSAVTP